MVPKIIHYIYFGQFENTDPSKTYLIQKCINSIYKFNPDYKIIRWDETNMDPILDEFKKSYGILVNKFIEFYQQKKYAYCSDIFRLFVLKKYSGIYVDIDVEFIKPIPEEFLNTSFMGIEKFNKSIGCGLIMAINRFDIYIDQFLQLFTLFLIDHKDNYGKGKKIGKTYVQFIFNTLLNNFFRERGFVFEDKKQNFGDMIIYPSEYFCPITYRTNEKNITENTISIHHYNKSWL